jgi:hypothetical protein
VTPTRSEAQPGPGPLAARLAILLPAGLLLLVIGMAITIAGIPVAALFRPGTWLILVALLATVAGGITRVVASADAA